MSIDLLALEELKERSETKNDDHPCTIANLHIKYRLSAEDVCNILATIQTEESEESWKRRYIKINVIKNILTPKFCPQDLLDRIFSLARGYFPNEHFISTVSFAKEMKQFVEDLSRRKIRKKRNLYENDDSRRPIPESVRKNFDEWYEKQRERCRLRKTNKQNLSPTSPT